MSLIQRPPDQSQPQFRPVPNSSYWAIQWPPVIRWVGQSNQFNTIQEGAAGVRITAWRQPNGRIGIFGDNLQDDYEYQYRFAGVRNHPWVRALYDLMPNKSAIDAYIVVPGFSRMAAVCARPGGDFEVWTAGVPYYDGHSLLWEHPSEGIRIARALGLQTLYMRDRKHHPQMARMTSRQKLDYLQCEAINEGVDYWLLKANQGASRFYTVRPTVSIFGKVTGWNFSTGSNRIGSLIVSMMNEKKQWKPVIEVRQFPRRILPLLDEMLRINVLLGRRVEIRAEHIEKDGLLVKPKFHRFAGKATEEMMKLATFVLKHKAVPRENKCKRRLKSLPES